jgi:hypothetical protein
MPELDMRAFRSFTYRKCRAEWDSERGIWEVRTPEDNHIISSSDKDGIKSYIDNYMEAYYGTAKQELQL